MKSKYFIFSLLVSVPLISCAEKGIIIVPHFMEESQKHYHFDEHYPKMLMDLNKTNLDFASPVNVNNPIDTHLHHHASELKLNFKLKEIVGVDRSNIFAYVPQGTYKNGWSGAMIFFNDPVLGACSFSQDTYQNIKMDSSLVHHDVNNKLSTQSVEGNEKSGYITGVSWYEETLDKNVNVYELNCAKSYKDDSLISNLIKLANKIDKQ